MSSQQKYPSQPDEVTPAKFTRYALIAIFIVVVLIAINVHLQKTVLVFGGGALFVVAVLAHLGAFAGLMKIITSLKKNRL